MVICTLQVRQIATSYTPGCNIRNVFLRPKPILNSSLCFVAVFAIKLMFAHVRACSSALLLILLQNENLQNCYFCD